MGFVFDGFCALGELEGAYGVLKVVGIWRAGYYKRRFVVTAQRFLK